MKIYQKIKSGALQFVVFIGLLIGILLLAIVALIHVQTVFEKQGDLTIQMIKGSDLGIAHALYNEVQLRDTLYLETLNEISDDLSIYKSYWGIYQKIISVSRAKNKKFTKIGLVGGTYEIEQRPGLYLSSKGNPLVMVGGSTLGGITYLPEQGISAGNIEGIPYYGNIPTGDEITTSRTSIPRISEELTLQISLLSESGFIAEFRRNNMDQLPTTIKNSFFEETYLIYEDGIIDLSTSELNGNVVVKSEAKIIVQSQTKLTDVILIAPEIEISNGVNGSFQAFATKRLVLGDNCKLNYPSALVVLKEIDQETESTIITVGLGSEINGVVFFDSDSDDNSYTPDVILQTNTKVNGEIYCNGSLQTESKIHGSVYCNNIIASRSGSFYQNHLLNTQIVPDSLTGKYAGLLFLNGNKGVAKWLY